MAGKLSRRLTEDARARLYLIHQGEANRNQKEKRKWAKSKVGEAGEIYEHSPKRQQRQSNIGHRTGWRSKLRNYKWRSCLLVSLRGAGNQKNYVLTFSVNKQDLNQKSISDYYQFLPTSNYLQGPKYWLITWVQGNDMPMHSLFTGQDPTLLNIKYHLIL